MDAEEGGTLRAASKAGALPQEGPLGERSAWWGAAGGSARALVHRRGGAVKAAFEARTAAMGGSEQRVKAALHDRVRWRLPWALR